MDSTTTTVMENAGCAVRSRLVVKVLEVRVSDLLAGDVMTLPNCTQLMVRAVDCFGGLSIVDFEDGTATSPVTSASLVMVEREVRVTEGGAR